MSFIFGFFIVPLIMGVILYWIIRAAVSGGMRDFDKWKRERDGGAGNQYDQYGGQWHSLSFSASLGS